MNQTRKLLLIAGILFFILLDRYLAIQVEKLEGNDLIDQLLSASPILLTLGDWFAIVEVCLQAHEKSLMVAGTLAVALFTWTLYRTARDQLAASRESLEIAERSVKATEKTVLASQRPWVSVEVGLSGPLVITETEVRIQLGIILKNVGKSPALNVIIESRITSTPCKSEDDHSIAKTKRLREELKQRPLAPENSVIGKTIFPDQSYRQDTNIGITLAEIKSSLPLEDINYFGLEIFGFVSYQTPFNDGIHLSYFGGIIGKHDPENPARYMMFEFNEKRLEPNQYGYGIWDNPFIGSRAD